MRCRAVVIVLDPAHRQGVRWQVFSTEFFVSAERRHRRYENVGRRAPRGDLSWWLTLPGRR